MMMNAGLDPPSISPIRAAAVKVVEVLQAAGHCAYFAGGCVRDGLLGIEPKDFDIATDAHPTRVQELFHRTIPIGEHFGVILVQLMGQRIEVATFRAEAAYSDHRRPDSVEFTDARADALRRDFTINGMFEDPIAQKVIDYVGGQADLEAGVIRAIGNAEDRLAEDHLRSLRAVRFSARFGFALEAETAAGIRRQAAALLGVSRERIGHELRAMFVVRSAARSIELLEELGLDAPTLLEDPAGGGLPRPILSQLETPASFATVLNAWALDRGQAATDHGFIKEWRRALVLTNDECAALREILRGIDAVQSGWLELPVARRKRLVAGIQFAESMRIMRANDTDLAQLVAVDIKDLKRSATGLNPEPLVNGDDLAGLGLAPGPRFREFLDLVYDRQLEGGILNRSEALSHLKGLIDNVANG